MTFQDANDTLIRPSGLGEIVAEDFVYKACKKKGLVVERYLSLHQDKFITYHNYREDKQDKRVWDIHHCCRLEPKRNEDIEVVEKTIRPPGTSTLKTIAAGSGKKVKLFCFSVYWPASWATRGYTSITFGCESREKASAWHQRILTQVNHAKAVRQAKGLHNRTSSRDSDGSFDCHDQATPIAKHIRHSSSNSMVDLAAAHSGAQADWSEDMEAPSMPPLESASSPPRTDVQFPALAEQSAPVTLPRPALNSIEVLAASERWVPYKHVNGVAIYYNHSKGEDGMGPEYMASSVVRGTPQACLDVLMNPGSHTTLLGPATDIAVLRENTAMGTQVLRLRVDAPGLAGRVCAPREVVLERMYKKDDESIHAIMFHTFNDQEEAEVSKGTPLAVHAGKVNPRPSLWNSPVKAKVQGGYTIAPLQGRGDDSDESLVTCILHVELGGSCSKQSWWLPLSETMGFSDAFVERMLMGVILVKDEVEHKRFQAQPFTIVAPHYNFGEPDGDADLSGVKRTTTMIVRNASGSNRESGSRMASSLRVAKPGDPDLSLTPRFNSLTPQSRNNVMFQSATSVALDSVTETAPMDEPLDSPLVALPSSVLDTKYWMEIHREGQPSPFKVRGPNYLKDRKKVQAGEPVFTLGAVDLVSFEGPGPTYHVARYLPSIRQSKAPFQFVIQLIVPGSPLLGLVVTLITEHHPDELGPPPGHPDHSGDWQPFDHLLHKFLNSTDEERNSIFKLIPHLAEGSWVIKQSVGTTPVILGRKLKTKYFFTKRYVEIDVDISANATATYVVSMVRGALKSLVVEMGFVLEGQTIAELPEVLMGAVRFVNMDLEKAVRIDTSKEIPMEGL